MLFLLVQAALTGNPSSSSIASAVEGRATLAETRSLLDGMTLSLDGQPGSSDVYPSPSGGAEPAPALGTRPSAALRDDGQASEGEEYANIYPKFSLRAGAMLLNNFNSSIQVSGSAGVGAIIDMEDLLDVESKDSAGRLDLHYSFNKRHWLDMAYFDVRRSGSTDSTTQDIDFGDISIPAGSAVSSAFDTRVFKLAYRYNFVTDARTVIGASFGVHSMGLHVKLNAASLSLDETFNQELPLPLFGLHGAYALSRKWSLLADAELLQFDLGNYRGFVSENELALNHDTFEHVGWGLSLNSFRVNGSAEGSGDLKADMDYGYQAVMLYLRFYL